MTAAIIDASSNVAGLILVFGVAWLLSLLPAARRRR